MTTSSPILVTGATGRHGGTGAYLVRRLREEGHDVRVLARTRSDRTTALTALGAEVVIGDLHDRRTIVPALDGIEQVYFTYPIDAGVIPAAANYAAAVREAGTAPRTIVMSMGPAHPGHLSDRGRDQWLAEEVLQWAGLDLLVLRVAAAFHENIPALHGRSIDDDGVIRNCFGDATVAWINGRDAGELAVAALLHPERFTGPIHYAAGAEELSHTDIATILTEELRRPVRFEPVSADDWRREIVELSTSEHAGVVNPDMAGHITAVALQVSRQGPSRPADADGLTRLIGRPPTTFREYVRTDVRPRRGEAAR
ncbi:NmrA family NAD(P)-binding protein [Amycolatopsis sp. NPDC004169]|uniref:NmrA family NAD(P)-binding protein n=1 Tax=Amycolatopsis sp. NPDC004169 TaxID=3154453 RepID=UPI0033A19D95